MMIIIILYYNQIPFPSQMLLYKICELLWTMTVAELATQMKAQYSMDEPAHLSCTCIEFLREEINAVLQLNF